MVDPKLLPPPRFIVLEGGDGSGKTTIRKLLFAELAGRSRTPLSTIGSCWMDLESTEVITKARFLKKDYPISKIQDAYVADRVMLCDTIIRPAIEHVDVICDRYLYSDIVYNKTHFGIEPDDMARAYRIAGLLEPAMVLFMDVPPEIAVHRLSMRGKPINQWETLERQNAIYTSMKAALTANLMKWSCPVYFIDNTREPAHVVSFVREVIGL